ncbi:hypothetical protein CEXT_602841 [Caerostris extrusa]|uniref:Uncharacterized protein n=1 Tax=Caerostris extrusa TaxID=172846 RepID=A0AAV4QZZ6_CAEEX|nr:hypothetical protein CEXT_602841 [Caerostris extrusa]
MNHFFFPKNLILLPNRRFQAKCENPSRTLRSKYASCSMKAYIFRLHTGPSAESLSPFALEPSLIAKLPRNEVANDYERLPFMLMKVMSLDEPGGGGGDSFQFTSKLLHPHVIAFIFTQTVVRLLS